MSGPETAGEPAVAVSGSAMMELRREVDELRAQTTDLTALAGAIRRLARAIGRRRDPGDDLRGDEHRRRQSVRRAARDAPGWGHGRDGVVRQRARGAQRQGRSGFACGDGARLRQAIHGSRSRVAHPRLRLAAGRGGSPVRHLAADPLRLRPADGDRARLARAGSRRARDCSARSSSSPTRRPSRSSGPTRSRTSPTSPGPTRSPSSPTGAPGRTSCRVSSPVPPATGSASRSAWSTSTSSRASTTAGATRPATGSCTPPPCAGAGGCG